MSRFATGTVRSPSGTASAPPGMKSFCKSTRIRAGMAFLRSCELVSREHYIGVRLTLSQGPRRSRRNHADSFAKTLVGVEPARAAYQARLQGVQAPLEPDGVGVGVVEALDTIVETSQLRSRAGAGRRQRLGRFGACAGSQ